MVVRSPPPVYLARSHQPPHQNRETSSAAVVLVALWLSLAVSVAAYAGDRLTAAGDVLQYMLPATAAGLILLSKDAQGAWQFGESAALTLGATYALKYAVEERRPHGGGESFPSAHASIAFSAADFLRKRYGWAYGVPTYALASVVAYSRVEARAHHPQDVIAGAAIGIVSSYFFTRSDHGWQVQAAADRRAYGIRVSRTR